MLTPVHKLLADIRPQLFPSNQSQSPRTFFERRLLQVKRAITCLRSGIDKGFRRLTHRPANDNASKMVPGTLRLPESKAKDLAIYKKVYNPVNERRFENQSASLEKMLLTARENHIAVLLVNMPITAENAGLLPAAMLSRYNQTIKNTAAKYQANFIDLQCSPEFAGPDFIDSVPSKCPGRSKILRCPGQINQ